MPRNINRRVEVLFPVEDRLFIRYLRDQVLETYLTDNLKSRLMKLDGTYIRQQPVPGEPRINSQTWLLNYHQNPPKND
jgi:polyphosphate kinase